jgi:hypothetical protein
LKIKVVRSLEFSGATYPVMQRHIPEYRRACYGNYNPLKTNRICFI